MDQLIEDIKLWIDRQEAYGDKDQFYADILGRIRGHESETAELRQQLTVGARKATAYDALRQAICQALGVKDQDKITDLSLIFKVGSLSQQLADCQKYLAEIRTAIDDEVKSYERYGAACLFDGCDMIYAYTLRDIAAIAKDQKNG